MSEVPTREKVADLIEQLERMHPLDGLAPWTTAPIDLLPMLRLALSALDAQEAAGEGVTEAMVKKARNAMREAFPRRTPPTLDEVRAALLAVHPAIFAAGRARGRDEGLEKAAALLESGAAVSLPMVRAVLTNTAAALRMIKGGTP